MSSPGPGKGKKKRKNKGRGAAGRGRGRGQDLPTPGRHEEEVDVESEERPATELRPSVLEHSSFTTAQYDELPETGRQRQRDPETNDIEKVGEGGCVVSAKATTSSSSTAAYQQEEASVSAPKAKTKSKGQQHQVSSPGKSCMPSSSSTTKGKL